MRGPLTAGVDFGGTNIKCGLVDDRGRVVRSVSWSARRCARPTAFVAYVSRTIESLASDAGVSVGRLRGVGIGAPGPVDGVRGIVHTLTNVPGWHRVPLAARMTRRLGAPVALGNDVNLVALGESRFGAGRGARSLVCLTLGTGVGGGLVFNGQLYHGASGVAGEIGHMVIDPRGRRCGCGARGCLEAHVGTAAILSMTRRLMRRRTPVPLTPEAVAHAAQRGHAAAKRIWAEVGRCLGLGIGNVVNLLNPDRVVIGGGIANAWPFFYPHLITTMRAHALAVSAKTVRLVQAQLGNHAGVVGAAVLVWDQLKSDS